MDTDAAMTACSCCRQAKFDINFTIQQQKTNIECETLLITGVSICTLSLKFPMKAMMVIFCMSRSILLNCIMKRSSSVRLSRGLRSFSNCRRILTSFSVGWKRIKHSTKSTGRVRRSNLKEIRGMEMRNTPNRGTR